MNILLAGATGFIGRSLVPALLAKSHQLTVLTRDITLVNKIWGQAVYACSWDNLTLDPETFDAVINLAGENIATGRWSDAIKAKLIASRVDTTNKLIQWLSNANKKPHLYNASAIGIYGAHLTAHENSTPITESTVKNIEQTSDFSSELVRQWESTAELAVAQNIPLTLLRFAVVLKRHEGILKKLAPQFYLGLGSTIGSGNQSFSWIHIDDLVNAILFLLERPDITGAVNVCSPHSISQKEFTTALASVMNRPSFMVLPTFLVKGLFGQMGEELLLAGQRVYPERLMNYQFNFSYPDIDAALHHEWQHTSA